MVKQLELLSIGTAVGPKAKVDNHDGLRVENTRGTLEHLHLDSVMATVMEHCLEHGKVSVSRQGSRLMLLVA